MTAFLLLAFSAVIALGGLAFISVGSFLSLRETFTPWQSGLIVGGIVLGLSILIALLAWFVSPRRSIPPIQSTKTPTSEENRMDTIEHLGETIGACIGRQNIKTTDVMLAALVAGAILGASPELRQRLFKRKSCKSDSSASNFN